MAYVHIRSNTEVFFVLHERKKLLTNVVVKLRGRGGRRNGVGWRGEVGSEIGGYEVIGPAGAGMQDSKLNQGG